MTPATRKDRPDTLTGPPRYHRTTSSLTHYHPQPAAPVDAVDIALAAIGYSIDIRDVVRRLGNLGGVR